MIRSALVSVVIWSLESNNFVAVLLIPHANVSYHNCDEPCQYRCYVSRRSSYELNSFDPGTNTTRLKVRDVLHEQHTTDQKQNDY